MSTKAEAIRLDDLAKLRHALGVGSHLPRNSWGHRGYFVAGGDDIEAMDRLAGLGLVKRCDRVAGFIPDPLYIVTQKGRDMFALGECENS